MSTLFQYATDNVAPNATVIASTPDSDYPASNLIDGRPDRPAKIGATTGSFVLDFGSAQRVDIAAFGPHNLTPGLAGVRIQGNASDSWAGPSFTADFTIPAKREDGHSVNPFLDLTGHSGYSATGFRYWRFVFAFANGANVAVGELWLGATKRTLTRSFLWGLSTGFTENESAPAIENVLEGGDVLAYSLGTYLRQLDGRIVVSESVLTSEIRPWIRAARGRAKRFMFVLDSAVNDALFVRFANQPIEIQRKATNVNSVTVSLIQDAMGRSLY